jgi:hypothetical protein
VRVGYRAVGLEHERDEAQDAAVAGDEEQLGGSDPAGRKTIETTAEARLLWTAGSTGRACASVSSGSTWVCTAETEGTAAHTHSATRLDPG